MENKMRYMVTSNGLSVFFAGKKPFMVAKDHPNFNAILEAVTADKAPSYEDIEKLAEIKKSLTTLSYDNVEIALDENDELILKLDGKVTEVLSSALIGRLVGMLRESESPLRKAVFQSFAKFISNLYKNPSYRSVKQMYGFLEANNLPITQNGTFLAYKKVRGDYFDIHSGTFDNSVGKVVEMPRNQVEDNPEITCSHGLHVCSYGYLEHYSSASDDRIVICEVNPADVVSIPTDYNNAKMRVCKYTVVDEVPSHFTAQLSSYVYGKHSDGWINDTYKKLETLFKKFFAVEHVDFDRLPNTIGYNDMTPPVIEDFYKEAEAVGLKVPAKLKDLSLEKECVPTMKTMFQWLAKYDSDWVRPTAADTEDEADTE